MKRDMDLVLAILELLEKRQEISVIETLEVAGYDSGVVAYHLRRMYEGGLLDAEPQISSTSTRLIRVYPFGLTWRGHEFLDSMHNATIAAQVRSRLGGTLASVPFAIIQELALAFARAQAGLP